MEIYISQHHVSRGGTPFKYIVNAPVAIVILWLAVAHQTIRPDPVDVLHGAVGLLRHDFAEARVVSASRAIRDGKVASRGVTVEKHLYAENLAGSIFFVWRQR